MEKACCQVALPPRGVLCFCFCFGFFLVTVSNLFLCCLLARTVTSISKSSDVGLDTMDDGKWGRVRLNKAHLGASLKKKVLNKVEKITQSIWKFKIKKKLP